MLIKRICWQKHLHSHINIQRFGYYEITENEIKCKVAISKQLELDENCIWSFDVHQSDITKGEVIETLRHLSSYKAQVHNQMLKNGGNAMIESLVFLFGWSFRMGYMTIAWKNQTLCIFTSLTEIIDSDRGITYELLLRLTETIQKSFDHNSVTCAVLLDIYAAYDRRNSQRYN
ncbi:hypothetical protein RFI_18970 [Reticulomyxa filosa]|uniref:Uncharacterized protein n=1 Tax=Reticulomyxa filosa TaxID=46433 RepID=X6MWU9_RETFI|nr:hypothetical protein RFI_18970 [Reticulomyxa filosa]|eukprot:ETO18304.1 hypothetical protein RFI_18970 [Reticulomyxa filosa]